MKELIQRESFEWMVKATPQREWIEAKGMFLWLAFFFSEIGAGVYFQDVTDYLRQIRLVDARALIDTVASMVSHLL